MDTQNIEEFYEDIVNISRVIPSFMPLDIYSELFKLKNDPNRVTTILRNHFQTYSEERENLISQDIRMIKRVLPTYPIVQISNDLVEYGNKKNRVQLVLKKYFDSELKSNKRSFISGESEIPLPSKILKIDNDNAPIVLVDDDSSNSVDLIANILTPPQNIDLTLDFNKDNETTNVTLTNSPVKENYLCDLVPSMSTFGIVNEHDTVSNENNTAETIVYDADSAETIAYEADTAENTFNIKTAEVRNDKNTNGTNVSIKNCRQESFTDFQNMNGEDKTFYEIIHDLYPHLDMDKIEITLANMDINIFDYSNDFTLNLALNIVTKHIEETLELVGTKNENNVKCSIHTSQDSTELNKTQEYPVTEELKTFLQISNKKQNFNSRFDTKQINLNNLAKESDIADPNFLSQIDEVFNEITQLWANANSRIESRNFGITNLTASSEPELDNFAITPLNEPGNIEPLRDFPITGNKNSISASLNQIKTDLVIALKSDQSTVGDTVSNSSTIGPHNWVTTTRAGSPKALQQPMQNAVASTVSKSLYNGSDNCVTTTHGRPESSQDKIWSSAASGSTQLKPVPIVTTANIVTTYSKPKSYTITSGSGDWRISDTNSGAPKRAGTFKLPSLAASTGNIKSKSTSSNTADNSNWVKSALVLNAKPSTSGNVSLGKPNITDIVGPAHWVATATTNKPSTVTSVSENLLSSTAGTSKETVVLNKPFKLGPLTEATATTLQSSSNAGNFVQYLEKRSYNSAAVPEILNHTYKVVPMPDNKIKLKKTKHLPSEVNSINAMPLLVDKDDVILVSVENLQNKNKLDIPTIDLDPTPGTSSSNFSDNHPFYFKLLEIFPDISPEYLRLLCAGKDESNHTFEHLISDLLEGNYNRRERVASPEQTLEFDSQYKTLLDLFPDADPTYLQHHCERLIDDPGEYKLFVTSLLEHKSYPSKEDYLKKMRLSAQQKQYTTEFDVKKFLEVIPNPEIFFKNKKVSFTNFTDQDYALTFLKNHFCHLTIKDISATFKECQYNIVKTASLLDKCSRSMKTRRRLYPLTSCSNIPLLQEIAYVKNKYEILKYLQGQEYEKLEAKKQAKDAKLLKTCECCYDEEVMPNETALCNDGHIFCKECVRRGCEVKIGEGKLHFPCLSNCEAIFSLQVLQTVLTPKVFSKMAQRKQLEEVKSAGIDELEFCPFCEFASIPAPEDKLFRCLDTDCMKESCRTCKEPSHIPLRCDEVEKENEVKLRTYIEDKMTEALVRKCYKCNMKFIKEEGCNKMTCSCTAMMCYVCNQPVTDYKHFNGQGGDQYQLCPLYSDTHKLHMDAVKRSAENAKRELGIDSSQLKIDPTENLDQHYKNLAKKNPQTLPPGVIHAHHIHVRMNHIQDMNRRH